MWFLSEGERCKRSRSQYIDYENGGSIGSTFRTHFDSKEREFLDCS